MHIQDLESMVDDHRREATLPESIRTNLTATLVSIGRQTSGTLSDHVGSLFRLTEDPVPAVRQNA